MHRPTGSDFTTAALEGPSSFAVSGDTVWQRLSSMHREDQITLLEGDAANNWLKQRSFFNRIVCASQGQGSLTVIEVVDWEGSDCLKVSTQNIAGKVVDVLIDPQTMYSIAELQPLADGSIKQTLFSDYHVIEGLHQFT